MSNLLPFSSAVLSRWEGHHNSSCHFAFIEDTWVAFAQRPKIHTVSSISIIYKCMCEDKSDPYHYSTHLAFICISVAIRFWLSMALDWIIVQSVGKWPNGGDKRSKEWHTHAVMVRGIGNFRLSFSVGISMDMRIFMMWQYRRVGVFGWIEVIISIFQRLYAATIDM